MWRSARAGRHRAAWTLAATVTLAPASAWADGGPKFSSGWWLPVGITMGGAFRNDLDSSYFVGGEISGAYLWWNEGPAMLWLGGMADAVYDTGVAHAFRHRIGPEIGWWFLGTEVSYVGEVRDGAYRPGVGLRASGNLLGMLTLYGGWTQIFGDGGSGSFGEFGGLLKFPIPLTSDEVHSGPPEGYYSNEPAPEGGYPSPPPPTGPYQQQPSPPPPGPGYPGQPPPPNGYPGQPSPPLPPTYATPPPPVPPPSPSPPLPGGSERLAPSPS